MRDMVMAVLVGVGLTVVPVRGQEAEGDAATALHALFEEHWEYTLKEYPEFASRLGDRRYNTRWTDVSIAARERRHEQEHTFLEHLRAIDRDALRGQDRISYDLFERERERSIEGFAFRRYLMPVSQMGGIQTAFELANALSFQRVQDYEDWLARLRAMPELMDRTIDLMQRGIDARMMHPRIVMRRVVEQVGRHGVDDPTASPFFQAFTRFPAGVPESEQDRLADEAREVIATAVIPAYRRLHAFLVERYLPACPEEVGALHLPDGERMYAFLARSNTTTDLTPDEIHEIGLREVARILAEMEKVMREVGFDGSLEAFGTHLKNDPRFYYDDPDELLAAYRALCKRIDPLMVQLFGRMPRMPYGVEAIPELMAPDAPTAYYRGPAADGSRAGTVQVNLHEPRSRPRHEMIALMLHEGVPGHHFQIALAMELEDLPAFRRYGGYTAFVEGWGLYSEWLGEELGLYEDPYDRFGRLSYEMWRACRLVVDTGMHHLGWSRDRAIRFLQDHTGKSDLDTVNEIDRYIVIPGQALAYKIGELKIIELRRRAADALGDDFDVRAFHDLVLANGAVPLDVLEELVDAWIAEMPVTAHAEPERRGHRRQQGS